MIDEYKMGKLVMDYLEGLQTEWTAIGEAIDDRNLVKSYRLITENPKITKEEFLKEMGIEELEKLTVDEIRESLKRHLEDPETQDFYS